MQLDSNVTATSFPKSGVMPVAPTPGNSGVMVMSTYNAPAGVTRTVNFCGDTAQVLHETIRGEIRSTILYVPAFGATPTRDILISYSGGAVYKYHTYAVLECSPLAASPLDLNQYLLWYDYLGTPVGWPLTLTAAAPTAQANELLIGMAIPGSGMADCLINATASPGFTSLFHQPDSNTYQGGEASFKVLDTIQTPTAAWSKKAGTTADHWDTLFVSLKFA